MSSLAQNARILAAATGAPFVRAFRRLDEALRILELRRCERILRTGRLPMIFALAIFAIAFGAGPFFAATGAGGGGLPRAGGMSGVLLAVTALGAALGGFLRVLQVWQQERALKTFHTLLLTPRPPGLVVITSIAMGALFGLALVAVPAIFGLIMGGMERLAWWQFALHLLLLPACATLGAALGSVSFFAGNNLVAPRLIYGAIALLLAATLGLWARIEVVEGIRARGWEEHPGRAVRAMTLMTPIPAVMGTSAARWWTGYARTSLGIAAPAWALGLGYVLLTFAASMLAAGLGMNGYRRLAEDSTRIELKPRAPTEDPGQEVYWKGFRNPVWTREVRTRLRSKDTAEFIFFASIAIAAGAFVPLLMTASDLSDPLQTARAAREVFFWLTMTLVCVITLVAPALTADVITRERASGTLEMLVGTPLRPREILVGKLLGAVGVLLLLASPSLPLFGLCALFHGADGAQVLQVYVLLMVTTFVGSFIGVMQSAIHARGGWSKMWSFAITGLFVALPGGPLWIAAAVAGPQKGLRDQLASQGLWAAFMALIWLFIFGLFWGNANEQLEYSEY